MKKGGAVLSCSTGRKRKMGPGKGKREMALQGKTFKEKKGHKWGGRTRGVHFVAKVEKKEVEKRRQQKGFFIKGGEKRQCPSQLSKKGDYYGCGGVKESCGGCKRTTNTREASI